MELLGSSAAAVSWSSQVKDIRPSSTMSESEARNKDLTNFINVQQADVEAEDNSVSK